MMKDLLHVSLVAIILLSCSKKTEDTKTEASYVMKNFRVESSAGCKSDTLQCASYEVNYPEFSGLDSVVERRIRREIEATVSMGDPEAEGKSMQQIGDDFIQEYVDFNKEMPDAAGGWFYNANVSVEVLTDTLISMTVHQEYYTGGAHGGSDTYFINVNPSTGAEFTLDKLLKNGYQEPLAEIGEQVFRQVHELPDTASLNENYYEFPDDTFTLNKNYGFRKEGIVFYYNNYEIAPYAAGPTEIVIPYERIKEWLR
ncbi:MAG TPA: DUF3298 domain-containing protein [Chryseolinea sp.]|nr:DUF3298 domain-containing protein [Chryseolinea sp.]